MVVKERKGSSEIKEADRLFLKDNSVVRSRSAQSHRSVLDI